MNTEAEIIAQKILEQIDQPESIRNCDELAGEITAGVEAAGRLAAEVIPLVRLDLLACILVTRALITSPQEKDESGKPPLRITGSVQYSDGAIYPDPAQFTPQDLTYLISRADKTPNTVLKARYNHLAYALAPRKQRVYAQAAVDAYLESARLFASADSRHADMDLVVELDQAVALALQVHDTERLDSLIRYMTDFLRVEPAERTSLDGKPLPVGRFMYDVANILIYISAQKQFSEIVSDDILDLIEQRMEAMAERNSAAGMHFLNHQLFDTAHKAAERRRDPERAFQLNIRHTEALVEQAEASTDNSGIAALVSGKYYEEAINEYEVLRRGPKATDEQKAVIDTRINELRLRLKASYQTARVQKAYAEIPVELEIDTEERDAILDELLAGDNLNVCLEHIVSEGSLLPNVASAKEQAEQARTDAPLQALIPRTHIADDIPVSHSIEDAERLAAAADLDLMLWVQINAAAILIPLFKRLETEKSLDTETLTGYFERWGLASAQDIEFLRLGFQHFFASDHASALHVLVPRYEALLRGAFEKGGTVAFRSRRTQPGSESITFGDFLRMPAVVSTLPEDLRAYIRLVFAEQRGWNLRNRIAHGLIRLQECTAIESTVVIHLLLLITLIRVNSDERED